jgi:hypothetical protein
VEQRKLHLHSAEEALHDLTVGVNKSVGLGLILAQLTTRGLLRWKNCPLSYVVLRSLVAPVHEPPLVSHLDPRRIRTSYWSFCMIPLARNITKSWWQPSQPGSWQNACQHRPFLETTACILM